jgi:hypothetical protein
VLSIVTGLVLTVVTGLAHGAPDCAGTGAPTDQELAVLPLAKPVDTRELAGGPFTVGDIRVHRQNIFPTETHWLARQANRFHPLTREHVLRAALPFRSGEPIDQARLVEAERVLRDKSYLYGARILVRRLCEGIVDLDVVVRDVWTLTPNVGYSRGGGDDKAVLGFSDVNFLGLGKDVELIWRNDDDRKGIAPYYHDPNLFGSRWTMTAGYADNDDGELAEFELERPFYALDARWSFGLDASHFRRDQGLYFLNDKVVQVEARTEAARISGGLSSGRTGRWIDRLRFGAAYEHEEFGYPAGFPDPGPEKREFAYPFVGWQRLEDRFEEDINFDRIGETEDVDLGISSYVELGWSPDGVSDGDQLMFRGHFNARRYLAAEHVASLALAGRGRYDLDLGSFQATELDLRASYRWQHDPKWAFHAATRLTAAFNLPVDRQLLLGGDVGLRGYPSRYQTGDRRFLVSLEERYYSNLYPFGLFRIGYAGFLDVGRAWYQDERPAWEPYPGDEDYLDTLVDVGIGLRIEPVRTRRDRVIHVDLAWPLIDGPEVESFEITVSVQRAL